jgi:hypothetical protein
VRGLTPVHGPLPVKFPLPDPTDRSIRLGCLSLKASLSGAEVRSDRVNAAIAGAKAAATQFSRNNQGMGPTTYNSSGVVGVSSSRGGSGTTISSEHFETKLSSLNSTKVEVSATTGGSQTVSVHSSKNNEMGPTGGVGAEGQDDRRASNAQFGGTNKVYFFFCWSKYVSVQGLH